MDSGQTHELAVRLGSSERALQTARQMLQQHVASAGEGQAGQLTATLNGPRRGTLRAPGLIARGRTKDLSIGVALLADPLILIVVGGAERALHWSLLPGGPSVTARADAMRLLRAIAAGGELTFQMGSGDPFPPLHVEGGPWDDEDEWRLFEDLAALEEWSGMSLGMPRAVSAEEATRAAQAASWARTQQVPARITDAITFSPTDPLIEEPDELRLHQDFGVELLGREIPLGEAAARIALRGVDRGDAPTNGPPVYRAWPAQPELKFWLRPPATRRLPPFRTQPDRRSPPIPGRATNAPIRVSFTRSARRQLTDVLSERRVDESRPVRHVGGGTAGLLDDIRGA